jgi:hypothetical protein
MSLPSEKGPTFAMTPARDHVLIQNDSPIVARILFNCPRATTVGRKKHLIGLGRSIESP